MYDSSKIFNVRKEFSHIFVYRSDFEDLIFRQKISMYSTLYMNDNFVKLKFNIMEGTRNYFELQKLIAYIKDFVTINQWLIYTQEYMVIMSQNSLYLLYMYVGKKF